jgi:hypothetical protein
MKTALIVAVILVLAGAGYYFFVANPASPGSETAETGEGKMVEGTFGAPVEYACADGKGLAVQFGNNVARLILSDGRTLTLEQTAADDSGVTYGNDTGVSVSLGDASAFVMENGAETFSACRDTSVSYPEVSE